jgi:hypothetical protein
MHRRLGEQLEIAAVAQARGGGRKIEGEQPAMVVRLEGERVGVGGALAAIGGRLGHTSTGLAPGTAVELAQHRAAPVALGGRWRVAFEAGTEGDGAGFADTGYVPR